GPPPRPPRARAVPPPPALKGTPPPPPPPPTAQKNVGTAATAEDLRRTKSSPLVRKIAQEHGVDISKLEGTGLSGRVTKNDILSFIESGTVPAPPQRAPERAPASAAAPAPPAAPPELVAPPPPRP